MILTELQGYMCARERASLAQLSRHFDAQPDALRGMLDRLVAKGRVRRLGPPALCAGCTICPPDAVEVYEWAFAARRCAARRALDLNPDRPTACPQG